MLLANEVLASTLATSTPTSYDSTKWTVPSSYPLIQRRSDVTPNVVGPLFNAVGRPVESTAAIPGIMPFVVPWSNSVDWVFMMDGAAAAATRRIQLYTFNRITTTLAFVGFITMTPPFRTASGNITPKGFAMAYNTYSTGTVGVSGTAVTGNGSLWSASRLAVGSRIGFGSTDPTAIVTWYPISAIGGDTAITLGTTAGTVTSGTAYVIEDLRAVWVQTHATPANGSGLYCAKGLSYADFTSGGTNVPVATTVDNLKACYWLAEASTQIELAPVGMDIAPRDTWTQQYVYVMDTTTNPKWSKYNIRTSETYSAGVSSTYTHFQFKTGALGVTGTIAAANNVCLAVAGHGLGSGVRALYFATTTRIYCSLDSAITIGSTTWQSGTMTENPQGGSTTFALTASMNRIAYASSIDKFIILTSGATAFRSYITQFKTDGGQFNHNFLADLKQINQSTVDNTTAVFPCTLSGATDATFVNGILYILTIAGVTALTNMLYAVPIGCDWAYSETNGQVLISPAIDTPNCSSYNSAYVMRDKIIGGDSLGLVAESFKLQYRTAGISDNSGGWNSISEGNSLAGVAGASQIQFRFLFRMISPFCIGSRIFCVGVTYNDISTASNFQPSIGKSDVTTKRFTYWFSTAFGSTVPTLYIRIYDALIGSLLVTDNSASPSGTWEKSTDGSTWSAYDTNDKANTTTYIRYTPASLADNINVRSVLTLA